MHQTYLLASIGVVAVMALAGLSLIFVDSGYAMAQHECHHKGSSVDSVSRGGMASMAAMIAGDSINSIVRMTGGSGMGNTDTVRGMH